MLTTSAFAITEAEVEAQVAAQGKEAVTGNVLIWFLCAVAFLKVSQKIDSFMASLGVNVGHTGGFMLTDVLLATRGVTAVTGAAGHAISGFGHRSSGSVAGTSTSSSPTGFFKGGLAGMVSRKVTNDAVKTATATTSAVHSAKSAETRFAVNTTTQQQSSTQDQRVSQQENAVKASKESQEVSTSVTQAATQASTFVHTAKSTQSASHENKSATTKATHATSAISSWSSQCHSIGGALFAKSLASGGSFANDVIGTVARGEVRSTGMITGDMASQALSSYMGITAMGSQAKDVPSFSNVEIGGGRITGIETAPGSSEGISFGMYHADQYTPPQGEYTTVHSADGTKWYKQYAQDAVERKPYTAPDNTVAYHERIIKKLPDPPKRKDRL